MTKIKKGHWVLPGGGDGKDWVLLFWFREGAYNEMTTNKKGY